MAAHRTNPRTKYATDQQNNWIEEYLAIARPGIDKLRAAGLGGYWSDAKVALSWLAANDATWVARSIAEGIAKLDSSIYVDDRVGGAAVSTAFTSRVTRGDMVKAIKALRKAFEQYHDRAKSNPKKGRKMLTCMQANTKRNPAGTEWMIEIKQPRRVPFCWGPYASHAQAHRRMDEIRSDWSSGTTLRVVERAKRRNPRGRDYRSKPTKVNPRGGGVNARGGWRHEKGSGVWLARYANGPSYQIVRHEDGNYWLEAGRWSKAADSFKSGVNSGVYRTLSEAQHEAGNMRRRWALGRQK